MLCALLGYDRIRIASNRANFHSDAAVAGLGVTVLPSYLCREAHSRGDLELVLPKWECPQRELFAAYPSTGFLSRRALTFIDFVEKDLRRNTTPSAIS